MHTIPGKTCACFKDVEYLASFLFLNIYKEFYLIIFLWLLLLYLMHKWTSFLMNCFLIAFTLYLLVLDFIRRPFVGRRTVPTTVLSGQSTIRNNSTMVYFRRV